MGFKDPLRRGPGGSLFVGAGNQGMGTSSNAVAGPGGPRPILPGPARDGRRGGFGGRGPGRQVFTSSNGLAWSQAVSNTGADLHGVAYDGTRRVAVGDSGTIITSISGAWAKRVSGTAKALSGVAFVNGLFIAVGAEGALLTSEDGVAWTLRNTGVTDGLEGAAWTGTQWVVVGTGGTVLTSTPATTGLSLPRPVLRPRWHGPLRGFDLRGRTRPAPLPVPQSGDDPRLRPIRSR